MSYTDDDQFAYDLGQRRDAEGLSRQFPNWYVMWGVHSRTFWAFPLFSAPPGTLVSAGTPAELAARMQHAETASTFGPHDPGPP
jgi:hypothetical protein